MIALRPLSSRVSRTWLCGPCSRRFFAHEVVRENDIVLLKPRNNGRLAPCLTTPLQPGKNVQFKDHRQKINADEIIGKPFRHAVNSPKGISYRICKPTLAEYVQLSPRIVTPIYPQDANLIVSLLDLNPSTPSESDTHSHGKLQIFEAGTGHGSLTLYLARAIHGANTVAPPIPQSDAGKDLNVPEALEFVQNLEETERAYNDWRDKRRAIIHTLDSSSSHSNHAQKTVRRFRHGLYYPNVDFHVGNINDYLSTRLSETKDVFLDHGILDLPAPHNEMEILGKCIKSNGVLITFCPSITQIITCLHTVKDKKLPFALESVLELGSGTGGREWDLRLVKTRALLKAEKDARVAKLEGEANATTESSVDLDADESIVSDDQVVPEVAEEESGSEPASESEDSSSSAGWEMICRPKVGNRIVGGGFVGVWKRIEEY